MTADTSYLKRASHVLLDVENITRLLTRATAAPSQAADVIGMCRPLGECHRKMKPVVATGNVGT